jgi:hypothetical protein
MICGSSRNNCTSGVEIPIALFKVIYDPRMKRANAFIMPNLSHTKTKKNFSTVVSEEVPDIRACCGRANGAGILPEAAGFREALQASGMQYAVR